MKFGYSVAGGNINNADGNDVVVGAPYYDGPTVDDLGKVFLFFGSSSADSTADWSYVGPRTPDRIGWSLAVTDVNSSSPAIEDIVIGAPYGHDTDFGTEYGKVFIFHGTGTVPASTPTTTLTGSPANTRFGWSVAKLPDIDGDGVHELIVGIPYYTNSHIAEGRVHVYRGGPLSLNTSVYWMAEPDVADTHFGWSVAGDDIDGDNKGDVIVGGPDFDAVYNEVGSAWVWYSDSLPTASPSNVFGVNGTGLNKDWLSYANTASAHYGSSVGYAQYYQHGSTPSVLAGAPDEGNGNALVWKYVAP